MGCRVETYLRNQSLKLRRRHPREGGLAQDEVVGVMFEATVESQARENVNVVP
jgi:hypothetical protein